MAVYQVQANLKTFTEFSGANYVDILDKKFRQIGLNKREYVVYVNLIKINKETDKAVCFEATKDDATKRLIWIPKSTIRKSKVTKQGTLVIDSYLIANLLK